MYSITTTRDRFFESVSLHSEDESFAAQGRYTELACRHEGQAPEGVHHCVEMLSITIAVLLKAKGVSEDVIWECLRPMATVIDEWRPERYPDDEEVPA